MSRSSFPKGIAGGGSITRSSSFSSWFSYRGFHHDHQMSLKQPSSSTTTSSSSPWLMLTPSNTELNFYSLAENRVLTVPVEKQISDLLPKLDFIGSSHGWLGLYNPYNLDLFLYNPISRRRIDLPPVRTLPNIPKLNLEGSYGCVVKLILSCDPEREDEDCRVMMSYNTFDALAFCCPGKSKEWTPIGQLYEWDEDGKKSARSYRDFVYSEKQQVFFCLTGGWYSELESWDLRDPCSPRMTRMYNELEKDEHPDSESGSEDEKTVDYSHLVLADSELLLVRQQVIYMDGDSYSQTIGFDIFIYDPQERDFKYIDDRSSLGGLALFIGFYNHSIALSTSEFPQLKPNSIYFTDPDMSPSKTVLDGLSITPCGHDIGIFNCQDKTFSPCYYARDGHSFKKMMVPAPMWFFPSTA